MNNHSTYLNKIRIIYLKHHFAIKKLYILFLTIEEKTVLNVERFIKMHPNNIVFRRLSFNDVPECEMSSQSKYYVVTTSL